MAFSTFAYPAEDGQVYKLKMEADTAAAGGFASQSGFTTNVYAKISKGNAEHGLRPRGVRLSRVATATVSKFLPAVSNAIVEALVEAGNVTIGGEAWVVTSAQAEDY